MIKTLDSLIDSLPPNGKLVLMPVSRLLIETPFRLDCYQFTPAGDVDLSRMSIESPPDMESHLDKETGMARFDGIAFRKMLTSMTGASDEVFETNATIAFVLDDSISSMNLRDHRDEIGFLSILSQHAERALDWLRFEFCRFDLPATLPGVAGTWDGSNSFACACVYDNARKASELAAGEAILHSVVSKGLGLELQESQCRIVDGVPLTSSLDGEVGGIAEHSLRLFSDVMNANTNTAKFLRAMTLLEFLAAPFEYQKFQDGKKEIIAHVSSTHNEYLRLLERFRQFSDLKNASTGAQEGYRTLMVHHGRFLEEVMPDPGLRAGLFRELQGYSSRVIADLVRFKHSVWSEIEEYRKMRRKELLDTATS